MRSDPSCGVIGENDTGRGSAAPSTEKAVEGLNPIFGEPMMLFGLLAMEPSAVDAFKSLSGLPGVENAPPLAVDVKLARRLAREPRRSWFDCLSRHGSSAPLEIMFKVDALKRRSRTYARIPVRR